MEEKRICPGYTNLHYSICLELFMLITNAQEQQMDGVQGLDEVREGICLTESVKSLDNGSKLSEYSFPCENIDVK